MSASDLAEVMERDHRALDALVRGDPEPKKQLFSHRHDVTLANPLGPPAVGWQAVERTLERAVSQLREGDPVSFERISGYTTPELAYIVEIERWRGKAGTGGRAWMSLRATTVFRLEDGEWKIVHRHADPISAPQPIETIYEQVPETD